MIRKLLIVAISSGMLALLSIGAAVAIGGPDFRAVVHDGNFKWDSGDYDGPVATRQFTLDATKPLEIDVPVDMVFERSDTVSMTVEGPKKAVDQLFYEDGRLELRGKSHGIGDGISLRITGPVMPELIIGGAANVELKDLRQPEFSLTISGAGNFEATGKVDKVTVEASGAGNVDMAQLDATDAEIALAGFGNVDINASGKVDASIAGAGNVTLHRKPRELDSSIAGLGNVEHDY